MCRFPVSSATSASVLFFRMFTRHQLRRRRSVRTMSSFSTVSTRGLWLCTDYTPWNVHRNAATLNDMGNIDRHPPTAKRKKACTLCICFEIYSNSARRPAAIVGPMILVPYHGSSLCNSFEFRAPVDETYMCSIYKWFAVTWLKERKPG